jgi:murein DD-endopeptidase MepM/ murein hydrolase activator NlpD
VRPSKKAASLGLMVAAPAAASAQDQGRPPGSGFEVTSAEVAPDHAYFDARQGPRLSYRFRAPEALDVKVTLVRRSTGESVRTWIHREAEPGRRHRERWGGLLPGGGLAPNGAYKFVIRARGAARAEAAAKFRFHDHVFPIPGPHQYREGEGDFGAPRSGGRVHEGKDVWAECGQKLIAARGGTVQKRGYDDELYGHYLVVDGRKTKLDYFYVHLQEPAGVRERERVRTGQRIGEVGASGNARSVGCMLHLELWPSGFRRGKPIDPEPFLRQWDGWS